MEDIIAVRELYEKLHFHLIVFQAFYLHAGDLDLIQVKGILQDAAQIILLFHDKSYLFNTGGFQPAEISVEEKLQKQYQDSGSDAGNIHTCAQCHAHADRCPQPC